MSTKVQLVLSGGAGTYSPDVGKERFLAGFLQCLSERLEEKTRYGSRPKAATPSNAESCKIEPAPLPVFEDSVKKPSEKPSEAAKFVSDMVEAVFKFNGELKERFPGLEKALGVFGPLLSGGAFLNSYRETLMDIVDRDTSLKQAMARSAGYDLDPQDVGCLAGRDAADAYAFFVQASFGLGSEYKPPAR